MAQFLDKRILLELWSAHGEFSQKFSRVCAAGLDSRSSFGDIVSEVSFGTGKILFSLMMMSDIAKAKLSS